MFLIVTWRVKSVFTYHEIESQVFDLSGSMFSLKILNKLFVMQLIKMTKIDSSCALFENECFQQVFFQKRVNSMEIAKYLINFF